MTNMGKPTGATPLDGVAPITLTDIIIALTRVSLGTGQRKYLPFTRT